jgi:hypothetical protein
MKQKNYPTVLEFIEALENEATVYRKGINVSNGITELNIKDCLRWTESLIKGFRDRVYK